MQRTPSNLVWSITLLLLVGSARAAVPEQLKAVMESGVRGGLIVHVGRDDGALISSLRINDSYVVQGLETDFGRISKIRKTIQQAGLKGKVTVREFDGINLPYIDNMVNLLVMPSSAGRVTQQEIMRVLTPGGTALLAGQKTVKPIPADIDEWTHYLHDASGNTVAQDAVVGPPRRVQWIGSPRWARHHDRMASMTALVSSGGRIFYIFDEGSMTALALADGWTLWAAKHAKSGHHSPEDLMVIDGLVWCGAIAGGRDSGVLTGRDLLTGEVKHEFGPDVNTYWFHQRCYRSKATETFFLPSRTGIEFVSLEDQNWDTHHWVRGGCIYGIMPCNGLVYAPPHACSCYIDAKLNGFCALAPQMPKTSAIRTQARPLQKGPAYGQMGIQHANAGNDGWPTYRGNNARSGFTARELPATVTRSWETELHGKLSALTIADGRVFVTSVDEHTVHALDEKTGAPLWQYIAGGRVDSPPTLHKGLAIFGSADGWVYALRARDGALAWRFIAAANARQLMSFEQLESIWPVSGSVLVQDGIVSFVAGRSMYLDGGLRLIQLGADTGEKINERVMDDRDPDSGKNLQSHVNVLNMPTGLPDVLSSDGQYLYMRTQRMDLKGKRQFLKPTDVTEQQGEGVHLFSGIGFLDDSYFHRGYWTYGKSIASGASQWYKAGRNAPGGRLLVVGDKQVYGYGRKPQYYRWATPQAHHLFASAKRPATGALTNIAVRLNPPTRSTDKCEIPGTGLVYDWSVDARLQVRALALTGKTLFTAGTPDVLNEQTLFNQLNQINGTDPSAQLAQQDRLEQGVQGSKLLAISTEHGEILAELQIDTVPVFDGMAAANGRLFLACRDGKVLCFE